MLSLGAYLPSNDWYEVAAGIAAGMMRAGAAWIIGAAAILVCMNEAGAAWIIGSAAILVSNRGAIWAVAIREEIGRMLAGGAAAMSGNWP